MSGEKKQRYVYNEKHEAVEDRETGQLLYIGGVDERLNALTEENERYARICSVLEKKLPNPSSTQSLRDERVREQLVRTFAEHRALTARVEQLKALLRRILTWLRGVDDSGPVKEPESAIDMLYAIRRALAKRDEPAPEQGEE